MEYTGHIVGVFEMDGFKYYDIQTEVKSFDGREKNRGRLPVGTEVIFNIDSGEVTYTVNTLECRVH